MNANVGGITRRGLGAIMLGLLAGFLLIMSLEMSGARAFPLPAGIDPTNREQMTAAMADGRIPVGAMVMVIAAYAAGSLAGGWMAARLAPTLKVRHALIVGAILTLMGLLNLASIPHPVWMQVATAMVFLPLAYLGGRLAERGRAG
jgi:hypothetical protein